MSEEIGILCGTSVGRLLGRKLRYLVPLGTHKISDPFHSQTQTLVEKKILKIFSYIFTHDATFWGIPSANGESRNFIRMSSIDRLSTLLLHFSSLSLSHSLFPASQNSTANPCCHVFLVPPLTEKTDCCSPLHKYKPTTFPSKREEEGRRRRNNTATEADSFQLN